MDERLRATLGFLEKLTLRPQELTADSAEAVQAAGVSEEALIDAIHVGALFNMIVRLADSLGWDVRSSRSFTRARTRCLRAVTRSRASNTVLRARTAFEAK